MVYGAAMEKLNKRKQKDPRFAHQFVQCFKKLCKILASVQLSLDLTISYSFMLQDFKPEPTFMIQTFNPEPGLVSPPACQAPKQAEGKSSGNVFFRFHCSDSVLFETSSERKKTQKHRKPIPCRFFLRRNWFRCFVASFGKCVTPVFMP